MLKRERKLLVIAFVSGAIITFLLFCGYRLLTQRHDLTQVTMELEEMKEEVAHEEPPATTKVALYFIKDFSNESFLVPEVREVPYTSTPEMIAVKELIKGPSDQSCEPVLPINTKVRGLEIRNGLAVLDLSQEAMKIARGSWGEALVVWSVVNTLTKFPGVEAVQILIEGNPTETLAGHFDLSRALRRNEQVIRDEWTR